ncbi:transposase [Streptomyces erythrochromogenes]|uniref:transposase n=1 Tax=Streptomyces erythrochromogenes TaxID=285574 RepID=UPI00341D6C2C
MNIAGVGCGGPGHRARFSCKLNVCHGRKNEQKSFTWQDYRDLIAATRQHAGTPIVWRSDNPSVHPRRELADYAEENKAWLRVYQLPGHAPGLNPAEGVRSLLERSIADFAAAGLRGLTRIAKRKLKKIQYRPEPINGCLTETRLTMEATTAIPAETTSST